MDDGKTSKEDISKAVDFTYNAVHGKPPKEREADVQKLEESNSGTADSDSKQWKSVMNEALNTDERRVMKMVKDVFADYFAVDAFDGMVANVKHGSLGLVKTVPEGEKLPKIELVEQKLHQSVQVAVLT